MWDDYLVTKDVRGGHSASFLTTSAAKLPRVVFGDRWSRSVRHDPAGLDPGKDAGSYARIRR